MDLDWYSWIQEENPPEGAGVLYPILIDVIRRTNAFIIAFHTICRSLYLVLLPRSLAQSSNISTFLQLHCGSKTDWHIHPLNRKLSWALLFVPSAGMPFLHWLGTATSFEVLHSYAVRARFMLNYADHAMLSIAHGQFLPQIMHPSPWFSWGYMPALESGTVMAIGLNDRSSHNLYSTHLLIV